MRRREEVNHQVRYNKRWSRSEDLRLLREVQSCPQNLHKCFVIVAEQLGRTESGVAGRWYNKVSKDPANTCFFTASPQHISENRKNGEGRRSTSSIWRRLIDIIRGI